MRRSFGGVLAGALLLLGPGCERSKPLPVEKTSMTETISPRVLTLPATGEPQYLMVMLHGVGASADSFLSIARALSPNFPSVEFLVVDGVHPFDGGGSGRQWFSVRGVTEQNRTERVREAGAPLSAWIDQELARRKLPGDRLMLLGFSQGAILANWLVLHRQTPPAATVALSGRLAVEEGAKTSGKPRVLIVHGETDGMMPPALAEEAATGLMARGADVRLRVFPDLAHGVDGRVLAEVKAFLSEIARP